MAFSSSVSWSETPALSESTPPPELPLSCPPLSFPHPAVIAAARDTHSSALIIFFVIPYSSLVLDNMLSVCFFLFRLPLFLFVREYRDDNNQSRDNCLVIGGHIHNLQSVGQGCQDNG